MIRDPARRAGWLPSWLRWGGISLPDPADDPAEDELHGGPATPMAPGLRRPAILVLLVVLAVGSAALIPVEADLVDPGAVVDAGDLVTVDVPADHDGGPVTGAYLQPRRQRSPSALSWLRSWLPSGRVVQAAAPQQIAGLDPLESAVLTGAGMAPFRSNAEELGFGIRMRDPRAPRASLGVLLQAHDVAAAADVAAGRRVLALGALDGLDRLGCPADARASVRAADPPADLVVIGAGCPAVQDLRTDGVAVLETPGMPDVLFDLAEG